MPLTGVMGSIGLSSSVFSMETRRYHTLDAVFLPERGYAHVNAIIPRLREPLQMPVPSPARRPRLVGETPG